LKDSSFATDRPMPSEAPVMRTVCIKTQFFIISNAIPLFSIA
jgi:hypothetical protein